MRKPSIPRRCTSTPREDISSFHCRMIAAPIGQPRRRHLNRVILPVVHAGNAPSSASSSTGARNAACGDSGYNLTQPTNEPFYGPAGQRRRGECYRSGRPSCSLTRMPSAIPPSNLLKYPAATIAELQSSFNFIILLNCASKWQRLLCKR